MALTVAGIATALITTAGVAGAGQTQTISYQVVPSRTISVGATTSVNIGEISRTSSKNTAGGTLTYSTDNSSPDKITVGINSQPATGVTLEVSAGAIGGCTGAGDTKGIPVSNVDISTAFTGLGPADLITGIEAPSGSSCTSALTYSLITDGAATNTSPVSKTVTYTIQAA
ncbi:MAG: hypothetical protein ACKOA9_02980 [Actinomycetota bacterium]